MAGKPCPGSPSLGQYLQYKEYGAGMTPPKGLGAVEDIVSNVAVVATVGSLILALAIDGLAIYGGYHLYKKWTK